MNAFLYFTFQNFNSCNWVMQCCLSNTTYLYCANNYTYNSLFQCSKVVDPWESIGETLGKMLLQLICICAVAQQRQELRMENEIMRMLSTIFIIIILYFFWIYFLQISVDERLTMIIWATRYRWIMQEIKKEPQGNQIFFLKGLGNVRILNYLNLVIYFLGSTSLLSSQIIFSVSNQMIAFEYFRGYKEFSLSRLYFGAYQWVTNFCTTFENIV